jgi:hypothetical protein
VKPATPVDPTAGLRPALILCGVLLILTVIGLAVWFAMRRRGAPAAQVRASIACLGFTLLTLDLCVLAWHVLPKLEAAGKLGYLEMPIAARVVDWLGGVRSVPFYSGGISYALVLLGLGMWVAALSEAGRGEPGLGRLRSIARWMGAGSLLLLCLLAWSVISFWRVAPILGRG